MRVRKRDHQRRECKRCRKVVAVRRQGAWRNEPTRSARRAGSPRLFARSERQHETPPHPTPSPSPWERGGANVCAGSCSTFPDGAKAIRLRQRWEKMERAISRVLSWTVIPLGLASPPGSSDLPGRDAGHVIASLFGLAPGGVCRAVACCHGRGALLPHLFTLTGGLPRLGGLFSVALSVGSRRPGVTWHPALWSPDFPRRARARRDCQARSAGDSTGVA